MKQKIKVGDRVRVVSAYPHIHDGETGTVRHVYGGGVTSVALDGSGTLWHCDHVVLLKRPVIVITSDGATTTATMRQGKRILRSATAKCSDKDEFDFAEGARVAFERLQGRDPFPPKASEEKPILPAKLVCVSADRRGDYTVGKVYKTMKSTNPALADRVESNCSREWGIVADGDGYRVNVLKGAMFAASFIPLVED